MRVGEGEVTILIVPILLLAVVVPFNGNAADWASCEHDLSKVRRLAGYSTDITSELSYLHSDLEILRMEAENCRAYPESFDLMWDGCQSITSDYNMKVDEYNSQLSEFRFELDSMMQVLKNNVFGWKLTCVELGLA